MDENMQSTEIIVPDFEVRMVRKPDLILAEAEMVALAVRPRIEKLQLFKTIGPSKHLYIEAWQMIGACFRVSTRIRETKFIDMGTVRGYEAYAEAFLIPTSQVVSYAEGMCLNDEENWSARPQYEYREVNGKRQREQVGMVQVPLQQLRSMAQTRASSKAYSMLFKWVAKLMGYEGTPAEEMDGTPPIDGNSQAGASGSTPAPPQRKSQSSDSLITEKQASRLWGIAFETCGKDGLIAIAKKHGFARVDQITVGKYDEIVNEVKGAGKPAPKEGAAQ